MIPLDVTVTVEPTSAGGGISDEVMTDAPSTEKLLEFCSAPRTRQEMQEFF